jgi:hypothetical protein
MTFFLLAYSQQQSELAREFLSFAQAQDDPIVGKKKRYLVGEYLNDILIFCLSSSSLGQVWKINI